MAMINVDTVAVSFTWICG